MNRNTRLGAAIAAALSNGAPKPLVAAILTIQHRGRLKRLFSIFAARFLEAFAEGRRSPASRHAAKRMRRAKATVDLVRARLAAVGEARPNDALLVGWASEADLPRIVPLRKTA